MKNKYKILLGILIILALGTGIYFLTRKESTPLDAKHFSEEYKNVSENNLFVYKNINEIINILEHGTGIVYLGFPECPWCQAYVPMLNDAAAKKSLDKIYYFNILEARKNNTKDYQTIVEILKNHLQYDDEGNKRIYVPVVIAVNNGVIVGFDDETSMISGEITPNEYWSEEKKSSLKEKLNIMLNDVINHCTTCNK